MNTPTLPRRAALAAGATALLIGSLGGGAYAKELTSGSGTTAVCDPVTSLGYKGDATTSDTGAATIQVNYGVKSCTKTAVIVNVTMFPSAVPGQALYQYPLAPLSGKFTVGVSANTSYQVRVEVYDAATGVLQGSRTIYAAAVRKGV